MSGSLYRLLAVPLLFVWTAVPCLHSQIATPPTVLAPVADDDADQPRTLLGTGDFNRDGIPDLVEIDTSETTQPRVLKILLGQSDGTFKELPSHPLLGPDPRSIVVGDFNADGMADLIVGDSNGAVTEFLGDGSGNMHPAGEIAHLGSVVSMAVGDFNHDGIPDLAASDVSANVLTIFLGNGKGAFRAAWSMDLPMPGTIYGVSVADFNGDGLPDLALTTAEDTYEVMLGNGNGTFTDAPALSKRTNPYAHCPA